MMRGVLEFLFRVPDFNRSITTASNSIDRAKIQQPFSIFTTRAQKNSMSL